MSHNATIYTVGIQLTGSAPQSLQNISSIVNGQPLYQNVSNMDHLAPVLEEIAGQIKIAGTQAVFKDYISKYFNFYSQAPGHVSDGTYNGDANNPIVTINVGDILKGDKSYKIFVQLKSEYWTVERDYPTNSDIHLDYTDVNDQPAHKDKEEIGDPELSVGYGTITLKYVLVNVNGNMSLEIMKNCCRRACS